jgi:hypothetical protein
MACPRDRILVLESNWKQALSFVQLIARKWLKEMVARDGIEPSTRGFSVVRRVISVLVNQSLAALTNPHSGLAQAQFGHTQSGLGTNSGRRATAYVGRSSSIGGGIVSSGLDSMPRIGADITLLGQAFDV